MHRRRGSDRGSGKGTQSHGNGCDSLSHANDYESSCCQPACVPDSYPSSTLWCSFWQAKHENAGETLRIAVGRAVSCNQSGVFSKQTILDERLAWKRKYWPNFRRAFLFRFPSMLVGLYKCKSEPISGARERYYENGLRIHMGGTR